jgi:NifU-like protein involved in Fe-S cluster formation
MYSEQVLDHFRNPRHAGKLENASASVLANNPVCGDVLELAARVDSDRIEEMRFLCRGCTTSIACGSWLSEKLTGGLLVEAHAITAEQISAALGGLPPATFHGAQLAVDALQMLLDKLR